MSPPIISKDLEKNFEKKETDAEIRNLVSGLGVFVLGCGGSMDLGDGSGGLVVLGDR